MQFGVVRTDLHSFKKGGKRDFRKNGHFKTAVAPERLEQIEFNDQHSKDLKKTFQIPVGKCFYLQNSIFGVFIKFPRFRRNSVT